MPKLRAGFTDEPLNGTIAQWIASSVSPIATKTVLRDDSLFVTARMTIMKSAEQKSSAKKAPRTPCDPGTVAARATSSLDDISSSASAARTAPANCAIQ